MVYSFHLTLSNYKQQFMPPYYWGLLVVVFAKQIEAKQPCTQKNLPQATFTFICLVIALSMNFFNFFFLSFFALKILSRFLSLIFFLINLKSRPFHFYSQSAEVVISYYLPFLPPLCRWLFIQHYVSTCFFARPSQPYWWYHLSI